MNGMEKKNSVLERRNRKNGARPLRVGEPAGRGKDESNEEKFAAFIRRRKIRKVVRYGLSAGCVICIFTAALLIEDIPGMSVSLMALALLFGAGGGWGYDV